jgi:hypothetical protein
MIRHNGIEIDRLRCTISVRDKTVKFVKRGVVFKVIEMLLLAGPTGVTKEDIYDATHGDREDGGTIGGPHDAQVWMWQQPFRGRVAKLGLKLVTHRHQSRTRYSLRVV